MAQAPKKRTRERPTVDSERAAIFEDLGHTNEDIRIKAATKLLARLNTPENDDELQYSLKRLFRGLCSSRKAARLGFSVVLTEILSQHAQSKVRSILGLWIDLTQTSGQMDGQEVRDHVMGRVFGAEAIVQSGILFKDESGDAFWRDLLNQVFELANKKVWAREECGWVAQVGIRELKKAGLGSERASIVLHLLKQNSLAKTSEGVALWILADELFPGLDKPAGVFDSQDPLARKNRAVLSKILREETIAKSDDDGKQVHRSSWSARPHFVWDIVLSRIPADRYAAFWRDVVDEGLFSKSPSSERKHWGLSLFMQQVDQLPSERISDVFTINLSRCIANQIAAKDRYLNSAAEKCLDQVLARAKRDRSIVGPVLVRVTEDDLRPIYVNQLKKTKFVENLAGLADIASVTDLVQAWTKSQNNATRLDLLVSVLRSASYPSPEAESMHFATRVRYGEVVELLTAKAYGDMSAKNDGARSQLWASLIALSLKENMPSYYPEVAVKYLQHNEQELKMPVLADDKVRKSVARACDIIKKLGTLGQEILSSHEALKLLLCLCIVQVHDGEADALEALEDLRHSYKDLKAGDVEGKARASVTIMEVILAFTSKPSTLSKDVAQKVFSMCLDIINEEGVASMVQILETKENLAGQNELFDENGDDDGDDDDGGDDESADQSSQEQDSDVEMIDGDASQTSSEGSSDGSSEESGSDEEADEELNEFDAKLAEALGTRRADQDLAREEEESSDSDMDDEQMEALDGHLSRMFKQRKELEDKGKGNKKQQKEAKQNVIVFNSRVLDLVKIFVDQNRQSVLALEFVIPLLQLIKKTQNKPLADKATRLVQAYFKGVKLVLEPVSNGHAKGTTERSKRLLADVHTMALQQGSNSFHSACSRASMLLVKVLLSNGGDVEDAHKIYGKTQEAFEADKDCGLKQSFFDDWQNWCQSAKEKISK